MSTSSVVSSNVPSTVAGPKRYHPALVALHWLIAILIFAAFFLAHGNEGEGERFRPGQGKRLPSTRNAERFLNNWLAHDCWD